MDPGIFFVLVASVLVAAVARWRKWPAPLLVTVAALAVSFLPFVPEINIDGHVLLNIVLPPLLYSAALDVSFVSFRRSMPQIRRLGVGLVVVTAAVVGLVAWLIMPSLTVPGALLLGAIVAPPDAVSAAAIGRKLGLPRRIMTVLSGESLINDATSLTLFRVFAAIVAGATLTAWDGIWQFAVAVVVGVVLGLVFGIGIHQLRMRIDDPVITGTFGLMAPFGAYVAAEELLGSGVLAVVAMGLYVGFNAPKTSYATRQHETPLWLGLDFLLESFVFAYIGLQLPRAINDLFDEHIGQVLGLSAVVLVVVLLVRPAFVFPANVWGAMWQRRKLARFDEAVAAGAIVEGRRLRYGKSRTPAQLRSRMEQPELSWRDNMIISWAGMRGVVTLATAVAAADLAALDPEPSHAIVVVAFIVTVGTLLLQGLTLPILIRRLGVSRASEVKDDDAQLAAVRHRTHEAGQAYLRKMRERWIAQHGEDQLAEFDRIAKRLFRAESSSDSQVEEQPRLTQEQFTTLSRGWLKVRRRLLLEERDAGNLSEEVMHELITAMDAEELALDTRSALRPEG